MTETLLERLLKSSGDATPTTSFLDWTLAGFRNANPVQRQHPDRLAPNEEAFIEYILDEVPASTGGIVVEVECDDALRLKRLAKRLEPSRAAALRVAPRTGAWSHDCDSMTIAAELPGEVDDDGIEHIHRSVYDLGWEPGYADVIVGRRVFNNIPSYYERDVLAALRDALNPRGGRLCLSWIEATSAQKADPGGSWWLARRHPGDDLRLRRHPLGIWPAYWRVPGRGEVERTLARAGATAGAGKPLRPIEIDAGHPGLVEKVVVCRWPGITGDRERPETPSISNDRYVDTYYGGRSHCARDRLNAAAEFNRQAERHRESDDGGVTFRQLIDRVRIALCLPADNDADAFMVAGTLALRLSKFRQAAYCLNRAIELEERFREGGQPSSDKWRTALAQHQLGFAFEGLECFERAIESAQSALEQVSDHGTEDTDAAELRAEIMHGLGHFRVGRAIAPLTSLGTALEPSAPDAELFRTGRNNMLEACKAGPNGEQYLNCLGSIHTEIHRADLAIDELEDALRHAKLQPPKLTDYGDTMQARDQHKRDLKRNDMLRAEILFYLAQAYAANNNVQSADAFDQAREIARRHDLADLEAQIAHWSVRAKLDQSDTDDNRQLRGMNADTIESMASQLLMSPPSHDVVSSVRDERLDLLELLQLMHLTRSGAADLADLRLQCSALADSQFTKVVTIRSGKVPNSVTLLREDGFDIVTDHTFATSRNATIADIHAALDRADLLIVSQLQNGARGIGRWIAYAAARQCPVIIVTKGNIGWMDHDIVSTAADWGTAALLVRLLGALEDRRVRISRYVTPLGQAPLGDSPSRAFSQARQPDWLEPCDQLSPPGPAHAA